MDQLKLSGVKKSYAGEVAIENLDLTVHSGELLTILGPSGCGKTTTLRAIAGLEEPDEGTITIGENIVFSRREGIIVPPEKRGLGLIFQSYALWPHMTVEHNITLALKQKNLTASEVENRLVAALDMVQLSELRKRYPSELSGGQQQRVAVARLIALRPDILLMDEPLSNLDAKLRTELRAGLKRLHQDLEATTVYVTHDQIEALTLSDRIVVMNEGRIMQQGAPYDIYHHPANLFVAEFIGDPKINLFHGTVQSGSLVCENFTLPLGSHISRTSGSLTATIRPESISVSDTEQSGGQEVQLVTVQPTGANTILQVLAGDTAVTVLQPGFTTMPVGTRLWIEFEPETINFFDPETTNNLAGT